MLGCRFWYKGDDKQKCHTARTRLEVSRTYIPDNCPHCPTCVLCASSTGASIGIDDGFQNVRSTRSDKSIYRPGCVYSNRGKSNDLRSVTSVHHTFRMLADRCLCIAVVLSFPHFPHGFRISYLVLRVSCSVVSVAFHYHVVENGST